MIDSHMETSSSVETNEIRVHNPYRNAIIWIPIENGMVTLSTLKQAIPGAHGLHRTIGQERHYLAFDETTESFEPPFDGWTNMVFEVDVHQSRASSAPSPMAMHPASPYPKFPKASPPSNKTIGKWMFYIKQQGGAKASVICVHPRFLVTYRHGPHLQLKQGDQLTVFKAEPESEQEVGKNVTVVNINEELDFVLLKSEEDVVGRGPPLKCPEKSERYTLAGFGNAEQKLSFLPGMIHSHGYFTSFDGNPKRLGPFFLGTSLTDLGDSGGGCWGANGLLGMSVAKSTMPPTTRDSAHSAAASFPGKNLISPANMFEQALLQELEEERERKENKEEPPKHLYHGRYATPTQK